ncbi:acyl-CoA thioesterase [Alkalibacterium sp. AK22]|uniref:acyl-CoA thioesterase n=1 Tax=Alkalibacterium sp. AK22 TaxID=1229520 RepID=UPI0012DDCD93|nr:acyl-CoA thioesterase [Alkalibacterium sp. AK22]
MTPHLHKVQYYETDQMQIVHHSNYIRWFEEARTHLLDEMGFGYHEMEAAGILIPVLSVQADYKSMVRFGESVQIEISVGVFTGVKMTLHYSVVDAESGEVRAVGESAHAFLDKENYRPLSLKRRHKELYALFLNLKQQSDNEEKGAL